MNDAQAQIKEIGLRDNGSNANTKIYSEVRAPSSTSPPSPRRISNPLGVPNSSLNLTTSNEAIQSPPHTRGACL